MKTSIFCLLATALVASSCVSLGKYEAMESTSKRYQRELLNAQKELSQMKNENADLVRQNQSLTVSMGELATAKQESDNSVARLTRELESARYRYDTMMENNLQQISGKNRDLNKINEKLLARTQELNEKEEAFRTREAALREQQEKLLKAEEEAKAALAAKEEALAAKQRELDQIRQSVTAALVGFTDKGMQVETKDGKVYVSMESKLMFPSASWTVSKEGVQAIKELAKVLEANPDLNIMVEGHTDNDPYKGSTTVKDNWDLSVMRATAIVKLLLQYGPAIDPTRIEAAGHGPYMPKVDNDTKENKAQNRRTEIILTPKLSDVLQMLGQ